MPIMVTELGIFRDLFDTSPLTATQWALGAGGAAMLIMLSEVAKLATRAVRAARA